MVMLTGKIPNYNTQQLDKCLETAKGEQRRLFVWMKAALQFPGLNQFVEEVKRAEDYQGKVSLESLHKAVEFAESYNEYQIRSLVTSWSANCCQRD